jgi:molecular chaperone IbpA
MMAGPVIRPFASKENWTMRSFDLSPLFHTSVGFDRLNRMLDTANRGDERSQNYPPYNIEKLNDNAYRIIMAVAGFGEDDIELTQHENALTITGKAQEGEKDAAKFLHQGIARRGFQRRFELADYIRVSSANMENGMLAVDLTREVPEEMKPRRIEIQSGSVLEHKAA